MNPTHSKNGTYIVNRGCVWDISIEDKDSEAFVIVNRMSFGMCPQCTKFGDGVYVAYIVNKIWFETRSKVD